MASFVSHKYKIIFCHIPRTGGTSFFQAIRPFLGEHDDIDSLDQHTPLWKLQKGRIGKVFDEYQKVTIWRDDADRLESLKRNQPNRAYNPKEQYWWLNYRWLYDNNWRNLCDYFIEFNDLERSAKHFLAGLGIEIEEFPHLNASK